MKVGFVGVGAMGEAMAGHLLARGRDEVFVYDLRPEAIEAVVEKGAHAVASPAEMALAAEFVVVMVVDDAQALAVAAEMAIDDADGTLIAISSPGASLPLTRCESRILCTIFLPISSTPHLKVSIHPCTLRYFVRQFGFIG